MMWLVGLHGAERGRNKERRKKLKLLLLAFESACV